jgi:membrane-associated phospholipid phosphatase
LIGAGASSLLLVLVWALAFHTGIGAHADLSIFKGFTGLQRPRVDGFASFMRDLCNPGPYVAIGGALIAVAVARHRPGLALAVGVVLLAAPATTELVLKPLLAAPRLLSGGAAAPPPGSWPSGHATAAMSLALALVLVAPPRRRPLAAALGTAFAVAVSYSFLTLGSHYPSDVLGGFLVAVIWVQLAVAGLSILEARRHRSSPRERQPLTVQRALGPAAWVAASALALALALGIARPHALSYAGNHGAFVIGAAAIAALALALATSVMLTVRR